MYNNIFALIVQRQITVDDIEEVYELTGSDFKALYEDNIDTCGSVVISENGVGDAGVGLFTRNNPPTIEEIKTYGCETINGLQDDILANTTPPQDFISTITNVDAGVLKTTSGWGGLNQATYVSFGGMQNASFVDSFSGNSTLYFYDIWLTPYKVYTIAINKYYNGYLVRTFGGSTYKFVNDVQQHYNLVLSNTYEYDLTNTPNANKKTMTVDGTNNLIPTQTTVNYNPSLKLYPIVVDECIGFAVSVNYDSNDVPNWLTPSDLIPNLRNIKVTNSYKDNTFLAGGSVENDVNIDGFFKKYYGIDNEQADEEDEIATYNCLVKRYSCDVSDIESIFNIESLSFSNILNKLQYIPKTNFDNIKNNLDLEILKNFDEKYNGVNDVDITQELMDKYIFELPYVKTDIVNGNIITELNNTYGGFSSYMSYQLTPGRSMDTALPNLKNRNSMQSNLINTYNDDRHSELNLDVYSFLYDYEKCILPLRKEKFDYYEIYLTPTYCIKFFICITDNVSEKLLIGEIININDNQFEPRSINFPKRNSFQSSTTFSWCSTSPLDYSFVNPVILQYANSISDFSLDKLLDKTKISLCITQDTYGSGWSYGSFIPNDYVERGYTVLGYEEMSDIQKSTHAVNGYRTGTSDIDYYDALTFHSEATLWEGTTSYSYLNVLKDENNSLLVLDDNNKSQNILDKNGNKINVPTTDNDNSDASLGTHKSKEDRGTHRNTVTPVTDVKMPDITLNVARTGLISLWKMDENQLNSLATELFDTNIFNQIKNGIQYPKDAVLKLSMSRINPKHESNTKPLKLGIAELTTTGQLITNHLRKFDLNYVDIPRKHGNKLDYEAKISLHLPFIKDVELDASVCMGRRIFIEYECDFLTGNCVAQVFSDDKVNGKNDFIGKKTHLLGQYCGNFFTELPLGQLSNDRILTSLSTIGVSLGMGRVIGRLASIGEGLKPSITHASELGSNNAMYEYTNSPMITIEYTEHIGQNKIDAYTSNTSYVYGKLGRLSFTPLVNNSPVSVSKNYIKCDNPTYHNNDLHDEENIEINELLSNGVAYYR